MCHGHMDVDIFVHAPYKLNVKKKDFKSSEFMQLRR